MKQILIIRFGALGDLCLLTWSLSRFAQSPEAAHCQVTLVTKEAFAPLMEKAHGIDRVVPLPPGGITQLWRLASQLREQNFDIIIDAHNTLRSHFLLTLMGKAPLSRLKKHTTARLALLGLRKSHSHLEMTMNQRFDGLFESLALNPANDFPAPFRTLGSEKSSIEPALGVAPGAQWNTKRWPEEYYAQLLDRFCARYKTPIQIFLGPKEETWFAGSSLEKLSAQKPQIEIIRHCTLIQITALLADCSHVVTNDSGLLHMAEAAGTPVLAFFGPTVKQFGYFPRLPRSRVLEVQLNCRPCSRNGKRECHRKDLACLKNISSDQAFSTLTQMMHDTEFSS